MSDFIRQCLKGHSFLGSANPECPWCELAAAQAQAARYRWIRDVCPPNEIQEHIMQLPLGTDQVIDEQIEMAKEKGNG